MAILDNTIVNGNLSTTDSIRMRGVLVATQDDLVPIKNGIKGIVERSLTTISANILMGATHIGGYAFAYYSTLTGITFPSTITSIDEYAFYYSGIASATIQSGLVTIGNYAFGYCSSLESISLPNSVQTIGSYSFRNCTSLTSITIGSGVTSIGSSAFINSSNIASVYYNGTVASWCGITFGNNNSNPVSIAKNLYINNQQVTSLVIPNTVTEIKSYAFYYFNTMTSLSIGTGVTDIGSSAFYYCSGLTSLSIPNNVVNIKSSAFARCGGLTTITIGTGVRTIETYAFQYCNNLTRITINATNPPDLANTNAFSNTNSCDIYVPRGTLAAYQSATNWASFSSRLKEM